MDSVKDVLTTGEVAKICNCSPKTVAKWIDRGSLVGYVVPNTKERRVLKGELINFCRKNKLPMLIEAKKTVLVFSDDPAEVLKKIGESELGVNIMLAQDSFEAGIIYGLHKPVVCIVECEDVHSRLSIIKSMCAGSSEVIVVTNNSNAPILLADIDADIMASGYTVKSMILAISQHI